MDADHEVTSEVRELTEDALLSWVCIGGGWMSFWDQHPNQWRENTTADEIHVSQMYGNEQQKEWSKTRSCIFRV